LTPSGQEAEEGGMTEIVGALDEIDPGYSALFCDLWGCLHDGVRAFPEAVAALEAFRGRGGAVALITNSPRPAGDVERQLGLLGAPRSCWDIVVSSGDAAQAAMAAGRFGRRVFHIGPERDLVFFEDADGRPIDVERAPLEEAEGIVCTGLFDDRTETPEDYRAVILYGKTKGLKLLCANPDIVVDVGEQRIYCAGAIAQAYAAAGGRSYYFGKPHPPVYALARRRLAEVVGYDTPADEILCIGDGIATDIAGAMGEGLDALFVTGGLAAEETGTRAGEGPDPALLAAFLAEAKMSPKLAMAYLR
jgi:HAD superfamily hydrolase (TIGR01459 family)